MTTVDRGDAAPAGVSPNPAATIPGRRPPLAWEALTTAFMVFAVVLVLAAIARIFFLIEDYLLLARVIADPSSVQRGELLQLADGEAAADAIYQWLFLPYVVAFVVWFVYSGKVIRRSHADPKKVLRHWTVVVWRVGIIALLFALVFVRRPALTLVDGKLDASFLEHDRNAILFMVIRALLGMTLVVAIVVLRGRIRGVVASASAVPLPAASPPSNSPARVHRRDLYAAGRNRPADDAFWAEVERLRRMSPAPGLPMLEWGATARQWHLLSSTATVDAAREVAAGASVIVYPDPPETVDERVIGRVAGKVRAMWRVDPTQTFFGLIEEAGTLRFDVMSTEEDLASWLAQARLSVRCAAYPAHDPDALYAAA